MPETHYAHSSVRNTELQVTKFFFLLCWIAGSEMIQPLWIIFKMRYNWNWWYFYFSSLDSYHSSWWMGSLITTKMNNYTLKAVRADSQVLSAYNYGMGLNQPLWKALLTSVITRVWVLLQVLVHDRERTKITDIM